MNTKRVYEKMLVIQKRQRRIEGLCNILYRLWMGKGIGYASYQATKSDMRDNGIPTSHYKWDVNDKQSRIKWLEKRIKELG